MLQVALRYLARVLQIEKSVQQRKVTLAATYLNISSVLANMNKYKESVGFSTKSNSMFMEMKEECLSGMRDAEPAELTGLVSSFFNLATSNECLGNLRRALKFANQGYHFALIDLGPSHPLANQLKSYLDRLSIKVEKSLHHMLRRDPNTSHSDIADRSGVPRTRLLNPPVRNQHSLLPSVRSKTIDGHSIGGRPVQIYADERDEVSIIHDSYNKRSIPASNLNQKPQPEKPHIYLATTPQPVIVDLQDGRKKSGKLQNRSDLSQLISDLQATRSRDMGYPRMLGAVTSDKIENLVPEEQPNKPNTKSTTSRHNFSKTNAYTHLPDPTFRAEAKPRASSVDPSSNRMPSLPLAAVVNHPIQSSSVTPGMTDIPKRPPLLPPRGQPVNTQTQETPKKQMGGGHSSSVPEGRSPPPLQLTTHQLPSIGLYYGPSTVNKGKTVPGTKLLLPPQIGTSAANSSSIKTDLEEIAMLAGDSELREPSASGRSAKVPSDAQTSALKDKGNSSKQFIEKSGWGEMSDGKLAEPQIGVQKGATSPTGRKEFAKGVVPLSHRSGQSSSKLLRQSVDTKDASVGTEPEMQEQPPIQQGAQKSPSTSKLVNQGKVTIQLAKEVEQNLETQAKKSSPRTEGTESQSKPQKTPIQDKTASKKEKETELARDLETMESGLQFGQISDSKIVVEPVVAFEDPDEVLLQQKKLMTVGSVQVLRVQDDGTWSMTSTHSEGFPKVNSRSRTKPVTIKYQLSKREFLEDGNKCVSPVPELPKLNLKIPPAVNVERLPQSPSGTGVELGDSQDKSEVENRTNLNSAEDPVSFRNDSVYMANSNLAKGSPRAHVTKSQERSKSKSSPKIDLPSSVANPDPLRNLTVNNRSDTTLRTWDDPDLAAITDKSSLRLSHDVETFKESRNESHIDPKLVGIPQHKLESLNVQPVKKLDPVIPPTPVATQAQDSRESTQAAGVTPKQYQHTDNKINKLQEKYQPNMLGIAEENNSLLADSKLLLTSPSQPSLPPLSSERIVVARQGSEDRMSSMNLDKQTSGGFPSDKGDPSMSMTDRTEPDKIPGRDGLGSYGFGNSRVGTILPLEQELEDVDNY